MSLVPAVSSLITKFKLLIDCILENTASTSELVLVMVSSVPSSLAKLMVPATSKDAVKLSILEIVGATVVARLIATVSESVPAPPSKTSAVLNV